MPAPSIGRSSRAAARQGRAACARAAPPGPPRAASAAAAARPDSRYQHELPHASSSGPRNRCRRRSMPRRTPAPPAATARRCRARRASPSDRRRPGFRAPTRRAAARLPAAPARGRCCGRSPPPTARRAAARVLASAKRTAPIVVDGRMPALPGAPRGGDHQQRPRPEIHRQLDAGTCRANCGARPRTAVPAAHRRA